MQAQTDPSDSLVFECDFDEPPAKVWRALTEPELLEAWLKTDDPRRIDSTGQAAPATPESAPRSHPIERAAPDGRSVGYDILTAEPHRRLRYRWRDRESGVGDSGAREVHSVVTVELAPGPTGGTHLRLTHGQFTIVSVRPSMTAARVRPITSARPRRTPILSIAMQSPSRRAA
jgi:uncharacterized protein YndB with AHSA1/START domain